MLWPNEADVSIWVEEVTSSWPREEEIPMFQVPTQVLCRPPREREWVLMGDNSLSPNTLTAGPSY